MVNDFNMITTRINVWNYTRFGGIPFMAAQFETDVSSTHIVSLAHVIEHLKSLQTSSDGINQFFGFPSSYQSVLTVQDIALVEKVNMVANKTVPCWARGGRSQVSPTDFCDLVTNKIKPNMIVLPTDHDTIPNEETSSRIKKALKRGCDWLDICLHTLSKDAFQDKGDSSSDTESFSNNLAQIPGGKYFCTWPELEKAAYVKHVSTMSTQLKGICFVNIPDGEPITDMCKFMLTKIPTSLDKGVLGVLFPTDVCAAISHGFNFIDDSLSYYLTLRQIALNFSVSNGLEFINFEDDAGVSIRLKNTEPLLNGCDCQACVDRFSVGYLQHLVSVKELMASTLLMTHNRHVFRGLVRHACHLKDMETCNEFDKFCELIDKQQNSYSEMLLAAVKEKTSISKSG